MRKFSRYMPPETSHRMSIWAWLCIFGLVTAAIAWAVVWPAQFAFVFGFIAVLFVIYQILGNRWINRHHGHLAAFRTDEDIGTFARAFNRRTKPFDPWVVRAN